MKARFYALTGLNSRRRAAAEWHEKLALAIDRLRRARRVAQAAARRARQGHRHRRGGQPTSANCAAPCAATCRKRRGARRPTWNVAVNGEMVLSGEASRRIASGDRVTLVPIIAGG
jgi:aldehyde:ferredoxin oxidoreductase